LDKRGNQNGGALGMVRQIFFRAPATRGVESLCN
jgi:hypothetical protein